MCLITSCQLFIAETMLLPFQSKLGIAVIAVGGGNLTNSTHHGHLLPLPKGLKTFYHALAFENLSG